MNLEPQHEEALKKYHALVDVKKRLGLSFTAKDNNLNNISAKFSSLADFMNTPDFFANLNQEIYISDDNEVTWFKFKFSKGKIVAINFLGSLEIKWVKIINKTKRGYDFITVGYTPEAEKYKNGKDDKDDEVIITVIPQSDVSPEKITKYFKQMIGQTANNVKEIGKLICHILFKYINNSIPDMLDYIGTKQGFSINENKMMQFNPPEKLPDEIRPYLSPSLQNRQYPMNAYPCILEDASTFIKSIFKEDKKLQLLFLYRVGSFHSSLFARRDVYFDNVLIAKPTTMFPIKYIVSIIQNTKYDSLEATPVGPQIKRLKYDIETINDGMLIVIDIFAADQLKVAKKGYDLLFSDAVGANDNRAGVYHCPALISAYKPSRK